jgi:NADP-dependent 3-hydroxy acid dehydrogenase YdfG
MKSAIDQTIHQFGRIDVLVNTAGFALMGPLEGASEENIKKQFDTNVLGVIGMIQPVLPFMREAFVYANHIDREPEKPGVSL